MMMMMNNNIPGVLPIGVQLFSSKDKRFIFLMQMSMFTSILILLLHSCLAIPLKPTFIFPLILFPLSMASYFTKREMDAYMQHLDPNVIDILALHRSQRMGQRKRVAASIMILMLWVSPKMELIDLSLVCNHTQTNSASGINHNILSLEGCCHLSSPPPSMVVDPSRGLSPIPTSEQFSNKIMPMCPVQNLKEIFLGQFMNGEEEEEEQRASAKVLFDMFCGSFRFRLFIMVVVLAVDDLWIQKVKRDITNVYTTTPIFWVFFHD